MTLAEFVTLKLSGVIRRGSYTTREGYRQGKGWAVLHNICDHTPACGGALFGTLTFSSFFPICFWGTSYE
jgi:hypothetical protein